MTAKQDVGLIFLFWAK